MIKTFNYSIFIVLLFWLSSCGNQKKLAQKQNQAVLYQPTATIIRPEYTVYHNSDSISQLLIKIDLNDLLFNQANPDNKLMARMRINYQLTDLTTNPTNNAVCDSSTFTKNFERIPGKQIVVLSIHIRAKRDNRYRLKITLQDLIRDIGNTGFITINKKDYNSAQNFKLFYAENNLPLFKNYLSQTDSFKIQINKPVSKLYIKYQAENLVLPPPPFSSNVEPPFSFQYDSLWVIPYTVKSTFTLPYTGLYLIQTDTFATNGLYLANFGSSFPLVKDIHAMVSPIEYLSTTEEYKNIAGSDTLKTAVDFFWLKLSGNTDISRELIRIYYNRMQYANQFFTSYKPGWKTDRGMIYIIFGPPSYIKKTEFVETWEYYVKQDATKLNIKFVKSDTPYSDNHYVMQRDNTFTSFWRDAVYSWRKGTAYSLEE